MSTIDMNRDILTQYAESDQIVVLDFWAPWCGPCHQFAPTFHKVASQFPEVVFGKVNVVENQELAEIYKIRSIPKVCVLKNNQVIAENYGAVTEDQLIKFIEEHVEA